MNRPAARTPSVRPFLGSTSRRSAPGSTAPRGGRRTTALAALVGLLGLLGGTAGLAAPAVAHDALTGSDPSDGSTVATPPSSIDLTFTGPPLGIGAEVQVTGPDGGLVGAGDLVITDTTVSQPLAPELPAGAYAVAWRVTSSDGHPISGELSFTATEGTVPAPDPTPTSTEPEPSADPTAGATEPAPDATVTEDPPGPGAADPGDTAGDADGSSPLPWLLGAVVLLAAAGAATWAARRRSGSGTTP